MDASEYKEAEEQPAGEGEPLFAVNSSRGFAGWIQDHRASIAVSTYQVGKLLMFGAKPDGKLWVFNRNIGRCLGLAVADEQLWVTGDTQIFQMTDALAPGEKGPAGEDAFYIPQKSYFTGDLDIHDLAIGTGGQVFFVNTLFNCIASASDTHSFVPIWRPPFISKLVPEDRCHLNGLAMRNGKPAFVTAVAESDTFDGWRDQRQQGGIVIDVETNEIICRGLSMPHSPRCHDGQLWLHNSGTGEFGKVDVGNQVFEPVCFVPGYLRGLDFVDGYAIMGLSRPRDNKTFTGLPLNEQLSARKMAPRCGVYVVDLKTGAIAHSLTMEGVVSELYDVSVINGKVQPAGLGPFSPELRRMVTIG